MGKNPKNLLAQHEIAYCKMQRRGSLVSQLSLCKGRGRNGALGQWNWWSLSKRPLEEAFRARPAAGECA